MSAKAMPQGTLGLRAASMELQVLCTQMYLGHLETRMIKNGGRTLEVNAGQPAPVFYGIRGKVLTVKVG